MSDHARTSATRSAGVAAVGLVLVTAGALMPWPAPHMPPLPGAVYSAPRKEGNAFVLRVHGIPLGLWMVVLASVAPIVCLTLKGRMDHVKELGALAAPIPVVAMAASTGLETPGPILAVFGACLQVLAVLWAAWIRESQL